MDHLQLRSSPLHNAINTIWNFLCTDTILGFIKENAKVVALRAPA